MFFFTLSVQHVAVPRCLESQCTTGTLTSRKRRTWLQTPWVEALPGFTMDMMDERDKRWSYGITLPAVARTMDEKHLTSAEAMQLLRDMLGPGEQPPAVVKSIRRLEQIRDEGQLRLMLGQEALQALDLLT